jgi:hypothetical protein
VLDSDEVIDSIVVSTSVVGLRNCALIALLVYSFARIGAALGMRVEERTRRRRRARRKRHWARAAACP